MALPGPLHWLTRALGKLGGLCGRGAWSALAVPVPQHGLRAPASQGPPEARGRSGGKGTVRTHLCREHTYVRLSSRGCASRAQQGDSLSQPPRPVGRMGHLG